MMAAANISPLVTKTPEAKTFDAPTRLNVEILVSRLYAFVDEIMEENNRVTCIAAGGQAYANTREHNIEEGIFESIGSITGESELPLIMRKMVIELAECLEVDDYDGAPAR
jgi:hypothetical protein